MEYRAGLWREGMPRDLMWYARTREWLRRAPAFGAREGGRVPSWSWASVDAPILFDDLDDAKPLATVTRCTVNAIDGRGTFEMIGGGQVEIRGPMAELRRADVVALLKKQGLVAAPPIGSAQDWYMQILREMETKPQGPEPEMDVVEGDLPDKVFGLVLFERGWTRNRWDESRPRVMETCYYGLLLKEIEGGCFERMGAFWNETLPCVDQDLCPWEEKVITIV
ncbi:hypothetical protein VTK26DRAFT_3870 [Humicola hyalothermophila]